MAVSVQHIHPVAHLPLVLGVLRRLEVATVIDHLLPPHPAHVLSTGRGVKALGLAMLDDDHALDETWPQHPLPLGGINRILSRLVACCAIGWEREGS